MQISEYSPYKEFRITSLLEVAFLGSLFSILLGWLYTLTVFIPIVYFNFLITIFTALLISVIGIILSKSFKITNLKIRLFLMIFFASIAYYSQWISFVIYIYEQKFPDLYSYLYYWTHPKGLITYIKLIYNYGTWSILFMRTPVNGFILGIVWIIEAFIFYFISLKFLLLFPSNPFSEKLNKWYTKYIILEEFKAFYSKRVLIELLEKEGLDALYSFGKGIPNSYTRVSIFYLENEETQYISFDNISINKDNNHSEIPTSITNPIKISTSEAKKIMNDFKYKKEFYFNY